MVTSKVIHTDQQGEGNTLCRSGRNVCGCVVCGCGVWVCGVWCVGVWCVGVWCVGVVCGCVVCGVWVCSVWVCGVWCVGVWCVNGGGNQNKEYGSLLTLPTKSTFLPLTIHIALSCALISPSLPLPLLLSPISTPPTVNNGPAWMTLVSLVLYSSGSLSQISLDTSKVIHTDQQGEGNTLCEGIINCRETLCVRVLLIAGKHSV